MSNAMKKKTQEDVANDRLEREIATQYKHKHLELAGKPLSEAADGAERVAIKLARLGRALEAHCMVTNDMHLLGMVRDALDDDDDDAIDQPDFDPEPVPVVKPSRRARRTV